MIFSTENPEKIYSQKLIYLPTLPVRCSHFTLGNPKSIVNNTTNTYFWLFALSQNKTNCNSYNAAQLFIYCRLLLPVTYIALFCGCGQFL